MRRTWKISPVRTWFIRKSVARLAPKDIEGHAYLLNGARLVVACDADVLSISQEHGRGRSPRLFAMGPPWIAVGDRQ